MFTTMYYKAHETKIKIHRLLEELDPRDPFHRRVPLTECSDIYESISADAASGANELKRPPTHTKVVEYCANDAKYKANLCEHKFHGGGVVMMSACFRDHDGNFVADFTQRQQVTLSTVEGEAWALLQAIKKANLRDLDMVQFESDS
ncbi:hypothetical protein L195_g021297 [Trifolium pratense]|uniref:RNase H type-1 domain-containing protein n=1 Tax=Trifolium pratense TaxID=57577 RepID=A0A2K3N4U8_TRIPR|nr:hypothetical protein L195_g021297 [Trifolium pratense]